MRYGRGRRRKITREAIGQQVLHGGGAALVGDVQHLGVGANGKQFARQVRCRTRAGGGIRRAVGALFGQGDKVGQIFDAGVFVHHQHVGEVHAARDGRQVLEGLIADLHHVRGNRHGADRAEQNHRAICQTGGDLLVNDVATGPSFVLDNDVLADIFGELFGNQTGSRIGRTTGRKTNEQGHGTLGREILGAGHAGQEEGASCQSGGAE